MPNPIRLYKRFLHERPFISNVLTSCTFMTTGDITSQLILQRKEELNLKQTARFALAGLIFVGPVVRGCLVTIERIFGPTTNVKVLGKKLLFDQGIYAPCFLVGNITTLTLLQYQSFEKVLNFYFIPLTYRVLFGSTAALIWNTIFSYKLYSTKKAQDVLPITNKD